MNCTTCGQPVRYETLRDWGVKETREDRPDLDTPITFRTLVGMGPQQPGHNHDDNCTTRTLVCPQGHEAVISRRNSCPLCDWRGKADCFCHPGPKVEEWPEL